MDIPVLYEDGEIVVIDKPSGVISNRAETVQSETIQDWMRARLELSREYPGVEPENLEYFRQRDGLVHRLDKETSGVMILTKTPVAFVELLRQFREREVKKTYLALTHGIWQVKEGVISLPIGRRRDDRKKMGVVEDGRDSVTSYRVNQEYASWSFPKELKVEERGYSGFSLVSFAPQTGRMHQIRVHARHMGHPVVGDMDYAGRKRSREDRKWCGHVMLMAASLELAHPVTHVRIKWESQMELLGKVGWYLQEKK